MATAQVLDIGANWRRNAATLMALAEAGQAHECAKLRDEVMKMATNADAMMVLRTRGNLTREQLDLVAPVFGVVPPACQIAALDPHAGA